MISKTFRMWVHADPFIIWSVLLDSLENPQKYMPDVEESSILEWLEGGMVKGRKIEGYENSANIYKSSVFERGTFNEIKTGGDEDAPGVFDYFVYEGGIIREIKVRGIVYKERILVSKKQREIHRELIDHPACSGKLTVKAVPISAQNPMAPVDLQFLLELEPKHSDTKEMVKREEEMTAGIREEQKRLKERAEELEMSA